MKPRSPTKTLDYDSIEIFPPNFRDIYHFYLVAPKTIAHVIRQKNGTSAIKITRLDKESKEENLLPCDEDLIKIVGLRNNKFAVISKNRVRIAMLDSKTYEHTIDFNVSEKLQHSIKISRDGNFVIVGLYEIKYRIYNYISHLFVIDANTGLCGRLLLDHTMVTAFDLIAPNQLALVIWNKSIQICNFDFSGKHSLEHPPVTHSHPSIKDIWTGFGPENNYWVLSGGIISEIGGASDLMIAQYSIDKNMHKLSGKVEITRSSAIRPMISSSILIHNASFLHTGACLSKDSPYVEIRFDSGTPEFKSIPFDVNMDTNFLGYHFIGEYKDPTDSKCKMVCFESPSTRAIHQDKANKDLQQLNTAISNAASQSFLTPPTISLISEYAAEGTVSKDILSSTICAETSAPILPTPIVSLISSYAMSFFSPPATIIHDDHEDTLLSRSCLD